MFLRYFKEDNIMNDYSISVRVETWDSAYYDKFRVKAKNSFAAKHKVETILFARHDRKDIVSMQITDICKA